MVTINTATCFQMQADLGGVTPGKCADPGVDVLRAFVFERHHATGLHAAGFVRGLGIFAYALALR